MAFDRVFATRLVTSPIAEAGHAARVVPGERWQIP